uniref:Uncharacterized protein n=1 Tax=Parascaris equorum TaxID=6256 RepID=A0A914S444_PAREQ
LSFYNLIDNINYNFREGIIRSLAILESSFIAVSELLPPLRGEPIKVVETDVPMKPLHVYLGWTEYSSADGGMSP